MKSVLISALAIVALSLSACAPKAGGHHGEGAKCGCGEKCACTSCAKDGAGMESGNCCGGEKKGCGGGSGCGCGGK